MQLNEVRISFHDQPIIFETADVFALNLNFEVYELTIVRVLPIYERS